MRLGLIRPSGWDVGSPLFGTVRQLDVQAQHQYHFGQATKRAIFVLGDHGVPGVSSAALSRDGIVLKSLAPDVSEVDGLAIDSYRARYKPAGAADSSYTTVELGSGSSHTIGDPSHPDLVASSSDYHLQLRTVFAWEGGAYFGDWRPVVGVDNPWVLSSEVTSSPHSGVTYGSGETIDVAVTFNEDVAASGDPQYVLCLASDPYLDSNPCPQAAKRDAGYDAAKSNAAGNRVVVFSYVVGSTTDSDGNAVADVDTEGISGEDYAHTGSASIGSTADSTSNDPHYEHSGFRHPVRPQGGRELHARHHPPRCRPQRRCPPTGPPLSSPSMRTWTAGPRWRPGNSMSPWARRRR